MKTIPGSGQRESTSAIAARLARSDGGEAFVPDPSSRRRPSPAGDAEEFGEEFVSSAVSGESVSEDARDEVVDDEVGGPFIVLDADAKLPSEPDEAASEHEGHDEVSRKQAVRGARWASRGG